MNLVATCKLCGWDQGLSGEDWPLKLAAHIQANHPLLWRTILTEEATDDDRTSDAGTPGRSHG